MLELYAVNIEKFISEDQYNKLLNKVSKEQQSRIKQFRFIDDAKRTLCGEVLIRFLACQKLSLKNSDIIIERNEYGKPFLKEYPYFHYNISHSGKWVVVAISDQAIGVDIEQIKSIDMNIARWYFAINECNSIIREVLKKQQETFYFLWTAKESYTKYIGKGLLMPLNSFSILKEERYSTVNIDRDCLIQTIVIDDYILSTCHSRASKDWPLLIKEIYLEEVKL